MKVLQTVGIDVSKAYLDFALYQSNQSTYLARIDNEAEALQSYLEALQETHNLNETLFCLETTGMYTQPFLIVALQSGAQVWLQSAIEISQSLGVKREKNDVLDACQIAEYAFRYQDKAKIYVAPTDTMAQMQALLSLRARLLETLKRIQTPLKELKNFSTSKTHALLEKCTDNTLQGIKADMKQVEEELFALLDKDEALKKNYELTSSVIGVGKWTALEILTVTQGFTKFTSPEKFACYCGVVPFAKSSGRKKGKKRVSFYANKSLKSLLHMCALSAIRHDEQIKAYYERKIQEGKPKMAVLNAIRNKIILRIFAVIRKGEKYEKKMNQNLVCS